MNTIPMGRNVVVLGPSCAGKSTLARKLGARLGLRVIELDALAWDPGWSLAADDVFRERIDAAIAHDGWVADGNYTRMRDLLWPAAGTAVWLDPALARILPRIVHRAWRRWRSKELLWGTNRESFWEHFMPNDRSLLWYTARTHRRRRRDLEAAMADPRWAHLQWVRLRSPVEVARWLEELAPAAAGSPEIPPGS